MIIDFHTHCFPDALAPRAMESLIKHLNPLGLSPTTDGTLGGLERIVRASGVDRAVVCNISTNPHQQHNVNSFAISIAESRKTLYSLGSLHPHGENKRDELKRLKHTGIKGIKIHPDYMGIDIDSHEYDEIFSLCTELDMFVVTHAGFDPYSPRHIHATPKMILRVHEKHPQLRLVAAHMGGIGCADEVIRYLLGRDIWLDTSISAQRPEELDLLLYILNEHPSDRLLFATDTPWSVISQELDFIYSAKLDGERLERILYKNALVLLED